MYGAIIGDIIGSIYEFNNIKSKSFPLFSNRMFFTDDSVMTVAVADALLNRRDPAKAFRDWGGRYPDMSYGVRFAAWLDDPDMPPYDSWGNGAAMRISPVALIAGTDEYREKSVLDVTTPTHGHAEGIRGARATVRAIRLAMGGSSASEIRSHIQGEFGYDLTMTVDQIRPGYEFTEACALTVPPALICVLESRDFEDAIRNAVSIGGDTDTVCAIAGPVAEALYGIPTAFVAEANARLSGDIRETLEALYAHAGVVPGERPALRE